ncbi:MAG: SDR family oxidoreductase [Gemmatirosa sp.]
MDLSTAHVLVTGGGTGIGRATAELLARRGARVAISGRRADVLERAARELSDATGATVVPIRGDVAQEADAVRMVTETRDALGDYDTLINNAGIGAFAPLLDVTDDDMRRLWETNVLGATLMARESARHFVLQQRGHIVNVASTAGRRAGAGSSAYASTKYALSGLTEIWRTELRQHGIRVMQINPSEVLTPFFESAGAAPRADNPTKLHAEDIAHVIASMLALDDRGFVTEASVWATNPVG